MYEVKNVGTAVRIIYDAKRRAKTILPGRSVTMSLSPETYDRLTESSPSIVVSGDRPVTETFDPDKTRRAGVADEVQDEDTAAKLIEDQKNIEYPEFVRRAKFLLGENWPGGTPKKQVVHDLLEEKAEADKVAAEAAAQDGQ